MIHRTEVDIRTFHTDAFGHVNNSRYLEILEEARWRYADHIGLTQLLRPQGVGFIIVELGLKFRHPIQEGDRVEIATSLVTLGTASGDVKQTIRRTGGDSDAVRGMFHFILVGRADGKSVPIEGEIRELLIDAIES